VEKGKQKRPKPARYNQLPDIKEKKEEKRIATPGGDGEEKRETWEE